MIWQVLFLMWEDVMLIFCVNIMDKSGCQIRNQAAIHFVTFSVVEWIDVFTRKMYRDIVLDSIRFCQENKGLLLHCWCVMSNHLHLILSAKNTTKNSGQNNPCSPWFGIFYCNHTVNKTLLLLDKRVVCRRNAGFVLKEMDKWSKMEDQ
ncbi:MAG: transposase [Sphingobacteriales bacterium]|nr:transposase [Sphingobacteriales bacterium]